MSSGETLHLPPVRELALGAVPRLVEGVFCPTALFLVLMNTIGLGAAIVGGFGWSVAVIVVRRLLGRRVPTLVFVGLGVLFLRTLLALATGSSFLYFIQPTVGAGVIGIVILASAFAGQPVVLRIARDFCPLPVDSMRDPHLRRFFLGISFLWGATQLLNAGVTLWLLVSQSVSTYVITRAAMSWTLTALAISVTVVWFIRMNQRRQQHALALVPVAVN
ncbi:MAG: VC0807 family protein [Acidimicrobiia bacterium]